jgi:hypothetical protein
MHIDDWFLFMWWNLSIMNEKWMFMINVFHNDAND